MLMLTTVLPHPNPKFPVDYKNDPISAGNETNDRVWLLSEDEAKELPISILKAESTSYAKSGGMTISSYTYQYVTPAGTTWGYNQTGREETVYADHSGAWWLRTPGKMQNKAMYVGEAGRMVYEGYNVDFPQYGIRPVIRISIA